MHSGLPQDTVLASAIYQFKTTPSLQRDSNLNTLRQHKESVDMVTRLLRQQARYSSVFSFIYTVLCLCYYSDHYLQILKKILHSYYQYYPSGSSIWPIGSSLATLNSTQLSENEDCVSLFNLNNYHF